MSGRIGGRTSTSGTSDQTLGASFLNAGEDDFHGITRSLWPEGCAVIGLVSERASRIDGVDTENFFVCLACNSAGAATVPVHSTNDSAGRTRRTRRTFRTGRPSLTPFGFGGILPASGEPQEQEQRDNGDLHTQLLTEQLTGLAQQR